MKKLAAILPVDKFYLLPGGIFCSKKPCIVDTILGSCVSIYLWDDVLNFSSINHYMLPSGTGDKKSMFKYGDHAIPEIIKKIKTLGSDHKNIKAKVFGGSETGGLHGIFNVGERNLLLAKRILEDEGIPIVSSSTGGERGRKVIFYTATGEVFIKFLNKNILID